ncbi:hypothetical protein TWF718_000365 [Orbilia javanica]|uniref:Uncharacterized protein n=1 Tax=Orbilia javanica TaxID=47235 RepID=A0AAN8N495_9PEZI
MPCVGPSPPDSEDPGQIVPASAQPGVPEAPTLLQKLRAKIWYLASFLLSPWKFYPSIGHAWWSHLEHHEAKLKALSIIESRAKGVELWKSCSDNPWVQNQDCPNILGKNYFDIDRESRERYIPTWPLGWLIITNDENSHGT